MGTSGDLRQWPKWPIGSAGHRLIVDHPGVDLSCLAIKIGFQTAINSYFVLRTNKKLDPIFESVKAYQSSLKYRK